MRQLSGKSGWIVLVLAFVVGCIGWDDRVRVEGSGVAKSEPREVEPFEQVTIGGAADAIITVGQEQSVTVEADDNIVPLIETRVENRKLIIETEGSYKAKVPVKVTITVPQLRGVAINGSGDAQVSGVQGESFAVAINGSGDVTASGGAENVNIAINGSGDVNLADVQAKSGKVAIAGSGDVTVNASDSLEVAVAGSGDVKYLGDPKIRKSIAGSGGVRKVGQGG